MQTTLNFTHRENTVQYLRNSTRLSKQAQYVYDWLKTGARITVKDAAIRDIGDLRARIRDIRGAGIEVKDKELDSTGRKEYYL